MKQVLEAPFLQGEPPIMHYLAQ